MRRADDDDDDERITMATMEGGREDSQTLWRVYVESQLQESRMLTSRFNKEGRVDMT